MTRKSGVPSWLSLGALRQPAERFAVMMLVSFSLFLLLRLLGLG